MDKSLGGLNNLILKNKIEEEIKRESENTSTKPRKSTVTKAQQILILHYLGILDFLNPLELTEEKKGKLVGLITDKNSKNVTDDIRTLNAVSVLKSDVKTLRNLKVVLEHFKSLDLIDAIKKVEDDINEIKKSKKL